MEKEDDILPAIIAGPILRRVDEKSIFIWLVTSTESPVCARILCSGIVLAEQWFDSDHQRCIQLGERAWAHLLSLSPDGGVPEKVWLHYDIGVSMDGTRGRAVVWLEELMPDICFAGEHQPRFVRKTCLDTVLHGSCRKPHHSGKDGFMATERVLAEARCSGLEPDLPGHTTATQPALLMLHGDQVYLDDVAGPTLLAIKSVVQMLGLRDEAIAGSDRVAAGTELLQNNSHLYDRLNLLPDNPVNTTLIATVFQGANKPIFTSANAENHLITLAEVLAMYLLVWSPELWKTIQVDTPADLSEKHSMRFRREAEEIIRFVGTLSVARRVMANVPTYMIFDDHDVTDDWNLSQAWQERAYGHPFSRRIIGNALIGYLICQGWGNNPAVFSPELLQQVRESLAEDEPQAHDKLIDVLLAFSQWGYVLDTNPTLIVMDARTRRWPSSVHPVLPSGLLDNKGLDELQEQLSGRDAVLLVSSAPIFGVKLIEVIQRLFAWCGMALTVDAENWMSHRGAAKRILGIFQHPQTPQTFVILSGDVHYSFAYDVRLRRPWRKMLESEHHSTSPHIWQITSSGIKNRFPAALLRLFDRSNRWLYAGYSPLNLLTRRRRMHIRPRRPTEYPARYRHQRLVNATGIGILQMDETGKPKHIAVRTSAGEEIAFIDGYSSDWH